MTEPTVVEVPVDLRMSLWEEFCMFVHCIDDDIQCDDDSTGVVLNACAGEYLP